MSSVGQNKYSLPMDDGGEGDGEDDEYNTERDEFYIEKDDQLNNIGVKSAVNSKQILGKYNTA